MMGLPKRTVGYASFHQFCVANEGDTMRRYRQRRSAKRPAWSASSPTRRRRSTTSPCRPRRGRRLESHQRSSHRPLPRTAGGLHRRARRGSPERERDVGDLYREVGHRRAAIGGCERRMESLPAAGRRPPEGPGCSYADRRGSASSRGGGTGRVRLDTESVGPEPGSTASGPRPD